MSNTQTKLPTLLTPVPLGGKRGWVGKAMKLDGTPIDLSDLAYLELTNSSYGTFGYGKSPVGPYDTWSFHQVQGGGVIIVPYTRSAEGSFMIGVVEQVRHNQGGKVLNVPRGFLDPGETFWTAANREFAEEVGALVTGLKLMPGDNANPNSAFFETAGKDEGERFFMVEVPQKLLTTENALTVFRKDVLSMDPKLQSKKLAEQITDCRFVTPRTAGMLGDMYTLAGLGRLMATCLS